MKRCLAYIRVSTTKQGERGSSLQEQRSAIEAYAARHDLIIDQWFVEMETAAKQGRREFNRLVTELRRTPSNGLIVHKIDRSARNLKDWACINDLMDLGIDIHFAHESLDLGTRGGRLAADIQAVVAADYIRNLRDEVRKGFYGRLKQGFYPLPAPRGYQDNGAAKAKTVDPTDGPLVREAFELYATGRHGLDDLRHIMARRGLLARSGAPLSASALAGMLHNPFYTGLIRIARTDELFEGVHEPLVSKAIFDRVQNVMAGRVYSRPTTRTFRFRRLIKCACGRSLTGEHQKGHVYYRCHGPRCRGTSFGEAHLDDAFSSVLQALVWEDRDLEEFGEVVKDISQQIGEAEAARKMSVERELQLIAGKLQRLADLLLEGAVDRTTYAEQREALLMRRRELQEQLAADGEQFWREVYERFELGNSLYSRYLSASDDEKRDILFSVGSNLRCEGKELDFTLSFPFEELRKLHPVLYGGPSTDRVRKGDTVRKAVIADFIRNLRDRRDSQAA